MEDPGRGWAWRPECPWRCKPRRRGAWRRRSGEVAKKAAAGGEEEVEEEKEVGMEVEVEMVDKHMVEMAGVEIHMG